MRLRNLMLVVAAGIGLAAGGGSASASFHLMQIQQVVGGVNGNTGVQVIQLRMRAAGQNLVSGARLRVFDANGLNPIIVCNMTTNVANNAAGATVLIATSNLPSFTSPPLNPDFVITSPIPPLYLGAGSLTFESDTGIVYWRLSWGGYAGPCNGELFNDADGNFCPAFPGVCPSSTAQSLQFRFAATAMSVNNANDYQLSPGSAVVTRNNGMAATLTGPVVTGACCFGDGACLSGLTATQCNDSGGTYQGDGVACTPSLCPVTTVLPGDDFWATAAPTVTTFGGSTPPIPPGFFAPSSEPFSGTVLLRGVPFNPMHDIADTVIRRQAPADLPFIGSEVDIPIELIALNLVSVAPITVTFNNGDPPEFWNVYATLSEFGPSLGSMTITRTHPNGGTWTSTLNVQAKFTFVQVGGGLPIDEPPFDVITIDLSSQGPTQWSYDPAPGFDYVPGAGPNFYPGIKLHSLQNSNDGTPHTLFPADTSTCPSSVMICQLNWLDGLGGYNEQFSDWGRISIGLTPADAGCLFPWTGGGLYAWINVMTIVDNGPMNWAVVNLQVYYADPTAMSGELPISALFDLGVEQGTLAEHADCSISFSPLPLLLPPTFFSPLDLKIPQEDVEFGGAGDIDEGVEGGTDQGGPWTHDAVNFGGAVAPMMSILCPSSTIQLPEIVLAPIDEDTNGCGPGSVAKSLDYLHLMCPDLPLPASAQDIYDELFDAMETSTAHGTWLHGLLPGQHPRFPAGQRGLIPGKQDYLNSIGAGQMIETTTSTNFADVAECLENGADVEIFIYWGDNKDGTIDGGHFTFVSDLTPVKDENGNVICWFVDTIDDKTQGDGTPSNTKNIYKFNADGSLPGYGPNAELVTFIVEKKVPCPGDITGPGGVPDGEVNVSDLLALLAAWDTGNAAADITNDGIVNVNDLLKLLAAWGPC
jgi:hypothetical protein